ncbi:MAG: prephenate dehydrogenase [Alphaproteobacteria bacterium]|nr:MAG: prephenate dehydrogenase [Alphaproteobacteria bacterium]
MERIRALWHAVGAETREMPADVHDAALAWTSHLPQVAASALASVLGQRADAWGESLFALSGRGLDDMTRLAASDPDMWADILGANRAHVLEAIGALRACLDDLAAALERGDRAAARRLVESGQAVRRRYEAGRVP